MLMRYLLIQFSNSACPQTQLRDLAARCARGLSSILTLDNKRVQGKPDARCTRGLVCKRHKTKTHTSIQVQRRHPAFPAQWFTAYGALSPVSRALLPPSPAEWLGKLGASFGRQDHTRSPSARATHVFRDFRVHRIPPHVRDDSRSAPLIG